MSWFFKKKTDPEAQAAAGGSRARPGVTAGSRASVNVKNSNPTSQARAQHRNSPDCAMDDWPAKVNEMADGSPMPAWLQHRLARASECNSCGNVCQYAGVNKGYILTEEGWAYTNNMNAISPCTPEEERQQEPCFAENDFDAAGPDYDPDFVEEDMEEHTEYEDFKSPHAPNGHTPWHVNSSSQSQRVCQQHEIALMVAIGLCLFLAIILSRSQNSAGPAPNRRNPAAF
jgi:hypothetical protein